jgi:lactaldehyde reductase
MEYNADAAGEKFKYIAKAMGVDVEGMTADEYKKAAVDAVKQLSLDIKIPQKLNELGVKEEELEALANAAFKDVCTPGNPRTATVEEILELYKKAF